VKGHHLGLYFDPPAPGPGGKPPEPLTLVPRGDTAAGQDALIDVDGGSLEVVGGRLRCAGRSLPGHVLRVRRGDLRLLRCRLEGPQTELPKGYRGLVRFEGAGKVRAEKAPACALKACVLESGGHAVEVAGAGARLYVKGCVVLTAGDALRLDPGDSPPPRLNVTCSLEGNTIATSGSVLHLADAPDRAGPVGPTVVRADRNLFLDPFHTQTAHASGLLRFDGAALPRGLLLWQGQDNGFDVMRLHDYAVPTGKDPPRQAFPVWARLWGPLGELRPRLLDLSRLPTEFRPRLTQLQLPPPLRPGKDEPPLGADLEALGIIPGKK
jgi:hypothetical protein